jgi:oligopeptide transport system permease protein
VSRASAGSSVDTAALAPARVGTWRTNPDRGGALALFVIRRLFWLVPVLFAVVLVTFALMQVAPGSPWNLGEQEGGNVELSDSAVRHLNATYGLDRPWWEQLGVYLGNVMRFDLGESYRYTGQQVSDLILQSLGPTFVLGAVALLVIVPVGIGLGVLAALRHNTAVDYAVTGLATLAASVPNFVVGILLIIGLSVTLHRATGGALALPAAGFAIDEHLVLPVATLSLMPIAFIARLTRSSTLETLRQDHVRTAHAKGLHRRIVLKRHVVRNSLTSVVTTLGPLFTFLLTGTIVVESLFQISGLGGTFIEAVAARDYPVILGTTLVYTAVVVAANLLVDIAYAFLDPRVRVS